ncbi:MAG: extracellular solute-binding protein [Cellulosilyticaceae bacterium]
MKAKKLVSGIMSLLIISTMAAGCSQKVEQTSTTAPTETKVEESKQDIKKDETKVEGQKSFTYWVPMHGNAATILKNYGESKMYQELEKRTGVKIEFVHPPQGSEKEQFNIMINSGDYPDMISQPSAYTGGNDKAIDDGVYLRLNELIDENAPNYKALRDSNPEIARQTITDAGNIWSMACIQGEVEPPWAGLALRMDWLEELGLEEPTTIQELENVLRAFKDQKGADAPLLLDKTGKDWTGAIISAFGIGPDYYRTEEQQVKYGPLEPAYKDYLTLMNKWYNEGLLDKEFVTRDGKSTEALITSGETGVMVTAYGSIDFYHGTMRGTEPNAKWQGVQSPTMNEGESIKFRQSNNYYKGCDTVVTSSCKDPAAAVTWLDYAYGDEGYLLFNYGLEGTSYEMVDGKPQFTELITNNPDNLSYPVLAWDYKLHMGPYLRQWDAAPPMTEEVLTSIDKWSVAEDAMVMPPLSRTADESKEYSKVSTEISTYVEEMTVKFITGVEPLENFDKYTEQLKGLGVEKAVKINQDALGRYNAR